MRRHLKALGPYALCAGVVFLGGPLVGCGSDPTEERASKGADKPAAAPADKPAAAPADKPAAAGDKPAAAGDKPTAAPAAAGDKPAAAKPGSTPAAGAAGAAAKPGAAPAKPQTAKERLLAEVHARPFRLEELNANGATVANPFHNNLDVFIPQGSGPGNPVDCPLNKYAIEELKLTAIVTGAGDPMAKAMFVDNTGVGHFLKRGDRVGRQCATVARVLSDKVVFEFTEDAGVGGKTRVVQRNVELYPGEQNPLLPTR